MSVARITLCLITLGFAHARNHNHGISKRDNFELFADYHMPTCEPSQSCSFDFATFRPFQLCNCPGERPECPKEHTVEHQNTVYRFCAPHSPPVCKVDEVSTVVTGLQTTVLCRCPDDMKLKRVGDSGNFVCKLVHPQCEEAEYCGRKSHSGHIRTLCSCQLGATCHFHSSHSRNHTVLGKCLEL